MSEKCLELETKENNLQTQEQELQIEEAQKIGYGFAMTIFYLVTQMAGAGFLSLPKAMQNTGWIGFPMMILLCVLAGFSGVKLGQCWVILEQRWPEVYLRSSRQPYMEIAYQSMGIHGRRFVLVCVVITTSGAAIVFLILIAQLMHVLLESLSTCQFLLIVVACLAPFTWLGSPKDFWQSSVLAVVSTFFACLVVTVALSLNPPQDDPEHSNPTIKTFSRGFSTILFAFGGAAVFPTIQNDMTKKTDFRKSVMISFTLILAMYLMLCLTSFIVLGDDVSNNILNSVYDLTDGSPITIVAIVMEILNLLATFLITFNPVAQTFEDLFNLPDKFGWKRLITRIVIILIGMLIGLAIPDFGKILNLIGGSTTCLTSFILPSIMYMKLVDDKSCSKWPEWHIPLWERTIIWEILIVGSIGGIAATVVAVMDIFQSDSLTSSCFVDFA